MCPTADDDVFVKGAAETPEVDAIRKRVDRMAMQWLMRWKRILCREEERCVLKTKASIL